MTPTPDEPVVSVCVVTYNQQAFIQDALLSVLAQAFDTRLEILVGDDGSSDGTAAVVEAIARAHPGLVTLYRHPTNLGAAGNYQFLIERARGRYIAHLDGDDYWLPGKLAAQLRFLDAHPECVAAYTNAAVVTEAGELAGAFNNPQPEVFGAEYLVRKGNFLNHSSLLYRAQHKGVILAIRGAFVDYLTHVLLARCGRLGYVNQTLAGYRVAVRQSLSSSAPLVVRSLYWDALLEAIRDPAVAAHAKPSAAHFLSQMAYSHLMHRDLRGAWRWAQRIRADVPGFTWLHVARGFLGSGREFWRLAAGYLSRRIYGSKVRLLHPR